MAELLSEKFREAIEKSDYTDNRLADLYDVVKGMSDEDFKEYMYANRGYFQKNMPAAIEDIEGFQSYVSDMPNYGVKNKIDYEKITGNPNALDSFYDYNMKDFEYFGSKAGMTGKEFMKRMAEDKTASDRHKIAYGEDEGGWFDSPKSFVKNLGGATMQLFAPRVQEAIARGEEPTTKDYLLDQASNIAETLPVGNIGKTRKLLQMGSNFIVPAAEEVADYVAYDEENPRGNLSMADIAKGGSINYATPRLLNRFGIVDLDKVGKNIGMSNIVGEKPIGPAGSISDIFTNKLGSSVYANRRAPGVIGVVASPLINYEEEKANEKIRNKNKEKSEKKYKGKLTRKMLEIPEETLRQWDAGFAPKAIEGDPLYEAYKQYMENK